IGYFAGNTGHDEDKIADDMERDFFMSAQEAVEYRIVDKILTREK
ncbi:MAG: ATP-dependent Clp protease proteolytic subunit, partial [Spirochaetales bacterium]|nr:ATP-dependent Clp protease proteolytic subunit [Spirochaetales bacterium]